MRATAVQSPHPTRAALQLPWQMRSCCKFLPSHFPSRGDVAMIAGSQQRGAIAQLGERLHGMQEVGGSIPPGSTISDIRPSQVDNEVLIRVPIV